MSDEFRNQLLEQALRDHPDLWTEDPPGELALLYRIYTGHYGDGPGVIYSSPGHRRPSRRLLRTLDGLGVIQFTDAAAGKWERGMWGARLTCAGANAVFRGYPVRLGEPGADPGDVIQLDGHPGCPGGWRPDGTCTNCPARRPLDRAAYQTYLAALDPGGREGQLSGPQLYCIEHGWMRRPDITTTKVCHLPGNVFHDGSLFRLSSIPRDGRTHAIGTCPYLARALWHGLLLALGSSPN